MAENSSTSFEHNFPTSSLIRASRQIVKTNQSGYDIICETNYQKNSQILFQITWTNKDGVERIVKSIKSARHVAKLLVEDIKCNNTQVLQVLTSTSISGVHLFGFDFDF
ncbi:9961_t:CDS:2 [Funneliformis caledonium]|uniref:9961_t:CDS:1 n=1 Tax=Funneliformis caledonium TaxID=1117310 RepID=A0A9N9G6X9_9GLOM|nr:9961_t:CDS:2 [Funneliformis caledonium]